jgi:beta-phosphoglucomutase-like phosphatase (HAD superfamily)
MNIDLETLRFLNKFKLVEIAKEMYRDDREKRKYLNVRTKVDLVEMIEERLTELKNQHIYTRATNPNTYYHNTPNTPPPTPTNERFIQSKYASFGEQPQEMKPKLASQKKTYPRHASHAVSVSHQEHHRRLPLPYNDIENTNAVVHFPE